MNSEHPHDVALGNSGIRVAIIGTLAILSLFLFAETVSVVQDFGHSANPATNTITVDGVGMASAVPDTATISFGASETSVQVMDGETKVTAKINAALAALKKEGIADKDIQTDSFNVSPHYAPPVCPPGVMCTNSANAPSGNDISQNVTVKVRDISKVSAVLASLTGANMTNISGPNLTVDDPDKVKNDARAQAIQKARAQAQVLAGQLGVHLGQVVNFSENGNQPYPMYGGMAVAGKAMATDSVVAPSVPTGENEYTSNVSITYEIR